MLVIRALQNNVEKRLKSEYRKVKDGHNKIETGRSNWRFLDAIDAVIGDEPATKPPVVIDSLVESNGLFHFIRKSPSPPH